MTNEDGSTVTPDEPMVKVAFRLVRGDDGFPPADWEHLWARPADLGMQLDNTPFFAHGVSQGDVVEVERQGGENVFVRVVRPSGHRTLRVILFRPFLVDELRAQLRDLGCHSEQSHIRSLIAVDVPPAADFSRVTSHLEAGERAGNWEFEIAAGGPV